jgi:hypothetical protein
MAKKKRSPEEMHRSLQDQVQALPYAITLAEKEGKKGRVFMLKYISGPIVRFMNRMMGKQRYKGPEGGKLKQSEQMKRHLEQRQKAMEYYQGEMKRQQQRQSKRQGKKK